MRCFAETCKIFPTICIASAVAALLIPGSLIRTARAQSLSPTFLLHGEPTELSALVDGSIVTPAIGPAGTLTNRGGSVNFSPATVGNGVYFLNCCSLSADAYYTFKGSQLANVFSANGGEISFNLQSRQSWAQRKTNTSYRTVLDVEDTIGNKVFRFLVNDDYGAEIRLVYAVPGAAQNYYIPSGQEDILLGNGVTLVVRLTWDGSNMRLYLNGSLVQTTPYSKSTPSWSSQSVFTLGGENYLTFGAAHACDDIIDEFSISQAAIDTTPPTTPTNLTATAISISQINLLWTASTDNVAVTGYAVYRNGNPIGTTANPSFSDTGLASGTSYTYAVSASDAAGNSSPQSAAVAATTLSPPNDTTPPTTPTGLTATATSTSQINLLWTASTDNVAVTGYAVYRNGNQIGTTANPSFSDTGLTPNTSYTYTVSAYDASGNISLQSVAAAATTFSPDTTPPVVSITAPASGTTVSASVTISANATDNVGVSAVQFQLDGSSLGAAITSSPYSVNWDTTTASNGSHVLTAVARDTSNNLTTSVPVSVTVNNAGNVQFLLHGEPTEVSGLVDGSIVTPAIGPAGTLTNRGGSVNFSPATVGNGVYFLNCCGLSADAYYTFKGSQLANVFSANGGEINFNLKSRQSWAQRKTNTSYRTVLDVEDTIGHKVYQFLVNDDYGAEIRLVYAVPGAAQNYYIPSGQEDILLGNGVTLVVRLTWDGSNMRLYLNGSLVQTTPYRTSTPSWSSQSVFTLGGENYLTYGAAHACDDIIDEFSISQAVITPDTTPPTTPTNLTATAISISQINLLWTASTDNVAVTGYTVYRNGNPIGTTANPSFSDTGLASGTSYTYAVSASDAAGNSSPQSAAVAATTFSPPNDTTPPTTPTGLTANATSTSQINLLWTASTDNVAVTGYTVYRNGNQIGTTANPSFSDTGLSPNTSYTYTVSAYDASGNISLQSVAAAATTFSPDTTPPVVSITAPASGTTVSASVTISANATDNVGVSAVQFQLDGSNLGAAITSSPYSVNWDTTTASNGSHVLTAVARDTSNNLTTSSPVGVTVNNAGNVQFLLHGEATELSALVDGSIVTPAIGPAGTLTNRGGSVNFSPATVGNGVYFLNCCSLSADAYYTFKGSQLANVFNASGGEINFNLKSRQSWAQRKTNTSYRTVLDVEDTIGHKVFQFLVNDDYGAEIRLVYAVPGAAQNYYIPSGQEDILLGNGVTLVVRLTWDGSNMRLYLNGSLVQTTPYSKSTPSWSSQSLFTLGGENYLTYGAAHACDDIIDEFSISQAVITPDTTPPTTPTNLTATAISTSQINLLWTASTDNVAVTGYTVYRNGNPIGTTANPSFPDTGLASGTSYTYAVSASDAAGNSSPQSAAVAATTFSPDTTPPVVSITAPASGATLSASVTIYANATDNVAVGGVQFAVDSKNIGAGTPSPSNAAAYSLVWDTTTVGNGTHALTATATDTSNNTAQSGPVTVTINNVPSPPVISNISVTSLTPTSATITWSTDQPADSQVAYGLTSQYGSLSAPGTTLATLHSVTLSLLAPATTYHIQVLSRNAAGVLASSTDSTFLTPAIGNSWTLGWNDLTGTILQNVCPPAYVDPNNSANNYDFSYNCHYVIDAYSGGIADTARNRLIIWGGGHAAYSGNELYSLDLTAAPAALTRLTDPSIPVVQPNSPTCPTTMSDGKPNARETYNNLAYIPELDQMFSFGGGLACGNAQFQGDTWLLNLAALQWQRMDPVNGAPPPVGGSIFSVTDYDPNTKKLLYVNANNLWQYDYQTNTDTALVANTTFAVPVLSTGVIDPKRKLFIFIGHAYLDYTTPHVYVADISQGSSYTLQDWSSQVVGCNALGTAAYPGLAYDPVLDRIVGWPNSGSSVYVFNPDTKVCVAETFPNGPQSRPPTNDTGTFGRFRYFPAIDAFGLVSSAVMDAFVLKLGPPTNDSMPPTSPAGLTAAAVSGNRIDLLWTASTDNVAVTGYAVYRSGKPIATTATPNFSDTGLTPNTSYTYTVSAYDASGNISLQSVAAAATTFSPDTTPPVVSITAPASGTTVSASVTISASATDNVGVSAVQFQLDGSNLGAAITSSPYSVNWDTTTASNGSHVLTAVASDASNNLTTSVPVSVTVNNAGNAQFLLHGEPTELSALVDGSIVTPAIGPAGTLTNRGGSVNFSPATVGNGVYFLNCCGLSADAYYTFKGSQLANVFSANGGEISFNLKSRQSWAQRKTNSSYRTVLDVEDTIGHKVYQFLVNDDYGAEIRLVYAVPGAAQNYYIPSGQEDILLGNGVTLVVRLTWDGSNMRLYLNGSLVQTTPYSKSTPSWSSQSVFTLGGENYLTFGAAHACDDVIDEFLVK